MGGRKDDTPPSPRDLKIIALEAELEEYKERDSKTNQIVNELSRKSRDLENEVCFANKSNNEKQRGVTGWTPHFQDSLFQTREQAKYYQKSRFL